MGNRGASGTGGAAGGYHAIVKIDKKGSYTVTVGSGGISRGAPRNSNCENTTNASATVIEKDGVNYIVVNGGTAGKGYQYSASAGSGGTVEATLFPEKTVYVKQTGSNGNTAGLNATASGAPGPISGHTWGASGNASASAGGGWGSASYNGYVMIKYKGKK